MYSYHNAAKKLIRSGHLTHAEVFEHWNNIVPALVLFFDNHRTMPIRQYNQNTGECNWDMYWPLIGKEGEHDSERRTAGESEELLKV